jgi:PleD family two-component response regulator
VVRALRFDEVPGVRVTVSIGVATARAPLPSSEAPRLVRELFARADLALYDAKRNGRDRTEMAGAPVLPGGTA